MNKENSRSKQIIDLTEEGRGNIIKYIYLLTDPRTDTPLYVGQASCVLTRFGQHLAVNPHPNPKLQLIFSDLKRLQILPKLQILEVTNALNVSVRERYYVAHYYNLYPNLCNLVLLPKPFVEKVEKASRSGVDLSTRQEERVKRRREWEEKYPELGPPEFLYDTQIFIN